MKCFIIFMKNLRVISELCTGKTDSKRRRQTVKFNMTGFSINVEGKF